MHVGAAFGRHGVGAQVGKGAAVVEARSGLQLIEQGDEASAVETGLVRNPQPNPVGLALHVARKIELPLQRHGLPACGGGADHVGIARGIGGQRTQNHGPDHPRRLLLAHLDQARDVALRHMRQLVRQHRSDFVGAGAHGQQAQVQAQVAAGQGKGIHAALAAEQQLPGKALGQFGRDLAPALRRLHQGLPNGLQVVVQQRVVKKIGVAVNAAHDLLAQAALLAQAQARGIAQTRQGAGAEAGRCCHSTHSTQSQGQP